ncbi:MAG: LL-diaminopimelate aminotransferase [Candidatus Omnitrophota bacterium]|nr:LL-diaminopimelate aminotransferase [Candidatus Omnitrophota bacterium]
MAETVQAAKTLDKADRLKQLPPYLFVEIDRAKRRLQAEGKDVIDLGVGDPDLPTPPHILAELKRAVDEPANHRYSFTEGISALREAIARWYARRFGVSLDPQTEVLPLLGSKEGLAHLPLALVNPGDVVLVPDPCYPPYRSGAILAGAEIVSLPLVEDNRFFPDLGAISQKAARRAKLLFLNYPNNPTAAIATTEQFQEAINFAKEYGWIVAHDAAYSEIAFDGYRPMSFLQLPEAKAIGVEFHSLSKTYNMTGWRIGWACGNAQVIAALAQVKTNLDSGIFQPIQWAGIAALDGDQGALQQHVTTYVQRRDLLVDGLATSGWRLPKPTASFYVWARVPTQEPSMAFAARLLECAQVVVTPGVGFGPSGEGYVRFSLTAPTERIQEAVDRIVSSMIQ